MEDYLQIEHNHCAMLQNCFRIHFSAYLVGLITAYLKDRKISIGKNECELGCHTGIGAGDDPTNECLRRINFWMHTHHELHLVPHKTEALIMRVKGNSDNVRFNVCDEKIILRNGGQ